VIVLSLGGGVQSTVLALMAVRGELELDHIIFSDPGNESKATYKHMEWLEPVMIEAGLDYRRVSGGNIYDDVMEFAKDPEAKTGDIGQPPFMTIRNDGTSEVLKGPLWRKCTAEYKILPIEREVRKIVGLKKHQHMPKGFICTKLLGISLDEVQRMKPSRNKWEVIRYPLIDMGMTRWDCFRWLEKHGYPEPPRSACVICPFHSDAYWRDIKNNSPDEFEGACKMDDAIRSDAIPGVTGEVFIHRSCVPLRDVDFSNDIDRGQGELFKSECDGYCGT
jgi:hypothetical protein